jgi:hypothetical protein
MAFGARRGVNSVNKEVLKFVSGLEAIESVVLTPSGVSALASAVAGFEGRLGLQAGTILTKISGDDQNRYKKFTGTGTIAGILADNVFFYDDDPTTSSEPAAMFFHGAVFDKAKIIEYEDYDTDLAEDLHTCRFEEKVTP